MELKVKDGAILCPVCDSPISPGDKECPSCGTDLTLFKDIIEGGEEFLAEREEKVSAPEEGGLPELPTPPEPSESEIEFLFNCYFG